MTGFHKGQAHLRRLYCAPDNSQEIIATCDKAYVPYLTYTAATRAVHVKPEDKEDAPRVSLPFPAIDLAWCPFKRGESEASFLTASRDQPLQLWDVEDASLRASYAATNDSDYHVHAHAVCWFSSASSTHWIAGGYGGFEDAAQVRVFDVVAEGSPPVWSYGAHGSHGLVSTLQDCVWPSTAPLLAVGYFNVPAVHLIDCRNRCPAAELHGLKHGVQSLRVSPEDPMCVYGGGSQGDSRISCWDLRKPRVPLFTLDRPVTTNQVFEFDLLPSSSSSPLRRLVTSCSSGGVMVYSWTAGETPSEASCVVVDASVGPTSGLAVVEADCVAVVTGSRDYSHHAHNLVKPSCSTSTSSSHVRSALEKNEQTADEEQGESPMFPQQKRARSPMTDNSDDEGGNVEGAQSVGSEATNVAIIRVN